MAISDNIFKMDEDEDWEDEDTEEEDDEGDEEED